MGTQATYKKVGECLYRNESSGTYYAWLKIHGKQVRSSLGTKDLPIAKRKLRVLREDYTRIDVTAGKKSLEELTKDFEATLGGLAEQTQKDKKRVLKRIRERWPGSAKRDVQKIKPGEAREFLAGFTGRGDVGDGASSHNAALELLRALFDRAVEDGIIARSPVENITSRKRAQPIRLTPSTDEFYSIVDAIRKQRFTDHADESADVVEFWGTAGLGVAEAENLRWSQVIFKRNMIVAFREKTTTGFMVPIFPGRMRALLERRWNNSERELKAKVFSVTDPKKALSAACAKLGLPQYSSRAFRRMFITTAIERGVNVKVIAEWQGHKDGGKLILSTYSHVNPLHANKMVPLMEL